MGERARLEIPPFDRLRVVSEVEPPDAGVRGISLSSVGSRCPHPEPQINPNLFVDFTLRQQYILLKTDLDKTLNF